MRCLLSLLTFFCFMRGSLGVYSGLDELQLSTLPLEAISKLSSLSAGPVARIMAFSDGLAGSWRGDNTRIDHHQGELAAAFRDQPGQKRDEGRELSTPSFSCQRMNETFNPYFMCSDVVDYDYYLPAGSTLDDLEETVRASVPSAFGLMTGECLSDFKKMMCARVFPPCVDNGKCSIFFLGFTFAIDFVFTNNLCSPLHFACLGKFRFIRYSSSTNPISRPR